MTAPISGLSGTRPSMMMSGASMRMPPQQKMTNLYQQIDASGNGSITKSQFQDAFNTLNPPAVFKNAGVDAIFSQLDPQRTGKVSQADFVSGMKELMVSLRASTDTMNTLGS